MTEERVQLHPQQNHPVLFALTPHPLARSLGQQLPAQPGQLDSRRFPDGESYLRVESDVSGRPCIILADLSRPDDKYLPMVYLAATLRELGATSVGLVAPYLCYMRQDFRFMPGEAVTSRIFAGQLSREMDWLITVDPHLHRYQTLDEIYTIPTRVLHATSLLTAWLAAREQLLLIGPDQESHQWVSDVATQSGHPFVIGTKLRRGDRDVQVTLPDLRPYQDRTAVIIDDVIASGETLLKTVDALQAQGLGTIDCAAIHGIFADSSDQRLLDKGVRQLMTTNSIPYTGPQLDLTALLLAPIREFVAR
ncbi:ribose-phosphate diphosphokinase [Photobacterium sp. TY1-4]|uniref:ribose-phosphate diphosphokinase n=1 Tax=Photobacterium sp. TY1-4 TaxID=2899122 RepID=UPI0021BE3F16|nr:ribose-phosphate diphosphokinase [Photobacterium sp. TY1-4]UXI00073.1 ribose-phosphate diphosphokinase [Photobacterium sp. TY1-4]